MPSLDLIDRAIRAYTRTPGAQQPGAANSTVEDVDGKLFVFLRNMRGVLAVYAVKPDRGLRRVADGHAAELEARAGAA